MRTDCYSSLDFMYWILETVEENYQAVGSDATFLSAAPSSSALMHETVVDCALACGVEVPRTFTALIAKVGRYGTAVSPEDALGVRGAILYREGALTVSVGDSQRLVGIDENGEVSLYRIGITERAEGYWEGAFLLPEMRYL